MGGSGGSGREEASPSDRCLLCATVEATAAALEAGTPQVTDKKAPSHRVPCCSLFCRTCGEGPPPRPSTALTLARSQKARDGEPYGLGPPGSRALSTFSAVLGRGPFDACQLRGIKPITEALGAYMTPFLRPPFSTCFQILQEDQGESSKTRLSQEQKFFN